MDVVDGGTVVDSGEDGPKAEDQVEGIILRLRNRNVVNGK